MTGMGRESRRKVRKPAFIAPPPNKPGDVTSGMQKAASGGVIGKTGAPNALLAGQDIGRAAGSLPR